MGLHVLLSNTLSSANLLGIVAEAWLGLSGRCLWPGIRLSSLSWRV